jgi:hypothetical protein
MLISSIRGRLKDRSGRVSLGCLFMSVVLLVGCYYLWLFGMPFVRHSFFKDKIQGVMDNTFGQKGDYVEKMFIQLGAVYKIPLGPDIITVKEIGRDVDVNINYEVFIDAPFLKRTLVFEANGHRYFPQ